MLGRMMMCALALLAAGCTGKPNGSQGADFVGSTTTQSGVKAQAATRAPAGAPSAAVSIAGRAAGQAFASLPDHGQLLAYPGSVVRQHGAYTWHRANLSEAYALRAISDGHLQVTTPDGQALDFRYDRRVEHASGDWTWIGHRIGHELEQAVLTFGANAAFGSIAQPGKHPLRFTVRDGVGWLVETNTTKLADVIDKITSKPDFLLASRPGRSGVAAKSAAASPGGTTTSSAQAATAAATPLVDVVLGYTPGFATANGGNSGAVTRLNFLVDFANAAYTNSQLSGRVRLVATVPVNYPDNTDNNDTLEKLTGFQAPSTQTTPDPAFNALRAARETYGADLVSLVRKFQTPENGGCGVAWLLGGGKQGIDLVSGWDYLAYSVVSDGTDRDETDNKNYYCEDHTLAHELGHNMGQAHDRETAKGTDGVLDNPDDYGVSDYSFGYKKDGSPSGLYDVMAYGDPGQTSYNIFSNPRVTFCGGQPCGIAADQVNAADASLSLSQTMPTITAFRATVVPVTGPAGIRSDLDGDGKSDVLWRNNSTGANVVWLSAKSTTPKSTTGVTNLSWKVAGLGDFNGDLKSDILWRNISSGANVIWKGGNSSTPQTVAAFATTWIVAGVGDFNGDGQSDILWRNTSTGANLIWRSGNSATSQNLSTLADLNWKVAAVADFDGDSHDDIVWRHASTGSDALWPSGNNATGMALTRISDLSWQIVGAGDFDGDQHADLLWRHAGTGANMIWKSALSTTPQAITGVSNLDWKIVAVADYNGDGRADIFWRNFATGSDTIWLAANSATLQAVTAVTNLWWKVQPAP